MVQSILSKLKAFTVLYALPLVVFSTAAALYFTLSPSMKLWPKTLFDYDKAGHFGLFLGWTWNMQSLLLQKQIPAISLRSLILAALFGGAIEILQHTLPINRAADIFDFLADVTGAVTSILLFRFIKK